MENMPRSAHHLHNRIVSGLTKLPKCRKKHHQHWRDDINNKAKTDRQWHDF